jgi:acid phosphatase
MPEGSFVTSPRAHHQRRATRRVGTVSLAMGSALVVVLGLTAPAVAGSQASGHDAVVSGRLVRAGLGAPMTPIKHVIVIVGENHSLDNVFATYRASSGQKIKNLRSEGIVNADGSPGPHVVKAAQRLATDRTIYQTNPRKTGKYATLPAPDTTYIPAACDRGQAQNVPDARFPSSLPNAPFQITKYVPYNFSASGCPQDGAWVGDPLHRFYQMWQQTDHNANDLYVWTANTAGDDNGAIPPQPIHQGSVSMGFYNMAEGDAPLWRTVADSYAISDNYHQPQMGGTGVNHFALATGDYPYYNDGNGHATIPPLNQIENPNPLPGTNNSYIQDGYSGGSYTNCSAPSAPGVPSIMGYVKKHNAWNGGDCAPGHYYLLNNYNPAYNADGTLVDVTKSPFTVPPQTVPTIGNELSRHGISWGYFGQGLTSTNQQTATYCNICNPFQYNKAIMTSPLRHNIKDYPAFLAEAKAGTLPAVSLVKPSTTFDGHPASSTMAAFEGFARETINAVLSNPREWASTAIFLTVDENGGYYDSGYIQPLTFFGDGPRIPIVTISPWARPAYVDHTYENHVSILKFIEKNWALPPLSSRSLDNLPDPRTGVNRYVPTNGPAIGNLMGMFDFTAAPRLAAPQLSASLPK